MAFNAAYSLATTDTPDVFVLTDTSTGSDANLTGRQVFLYQADNTLLVPVINWPIGDSTIEINQLTQDYALNILVVWTSSDPLPSPSTYTYSQIYAFTGFGEQFYYQLTQNQTSTPDIIQDTNYFNSKMILRVELDSATQAINVGSDLYSAQGCITRYQYLIQNSNYFF